MEEWKQKSAINGNSKSVVNTVPLHETAKGDTLFIVLPPQSTEAHTSPPQGSNGELYRVREEVKWSCFGEIELASVNPQELCNTLFNPQSDIFNGLWPTQSHSSVACNMIREVDVDTSTQNTAVGWG